MSLWERHVVPHLVRWACGQEPVARQRAKVVPGARGRVLELGIGGGMNLPHYDRERVEEIVGIDPSRPLLADVERQAERLGIPVTPLVGSAEALPLADESVDSVVVTYTLCSIPDVGRALSEARRVLRPGGALHFCEHGLAPDTGVRRLQRGIEPVWKRLGGGCHLTRPFPELIERGGFALEQVETMYLPGLKPMSWNVWGVARPKPREA